jgi:DNA-binding XRE family transcriptional regulator
MRIEIVFSCFAARCILFVDYSQKTFPRKIATILQIISWEADCMERPSQINKAFGEQLRQARIAAGLTQEELAFRAGLDRTYISMLERGIKSPTLHTFFRLCRILGQQPDLVIARINQHLLAVEQEHPGAQQQGNATEEE